MFHPGRHGAEGISPWGGAGQGRGSPVKDGDTQQVTGERGGRGRHLLE